MQITAKVFNNTGFNAVNLPYSPSVLTQDVNGHNTFTPMLTQALDINQIYNLTSVSIKAFETQIQDADYLFLESGENRAYYVINDYYMSSMDVARLSITPDPISTIGGSAYIKAITGFWKRWPTYGQELVADDLLNFSEPPIISTREIGPKPSLDLQQHVLIASSLFLDNVKVPSTENLKKYGLYNYKYDQTTGIGNVEGGFIPEGVGNRVTIINGVMGHQTQTQGYLLYDGQPDRIGTDVWDRIQFIRTWGYENSILGAWRIPGGIITGEIVSAPTYRYHQVSAPQRKWDGANQAPFDPKSVYTRLTSATIANLDNLIKTIAKSPVCKCGIMATATGATLESRPSEISKEVLFNYDIRQNGCPMFTLPLFNRLYPVTEEKGDQEVFNIQNRTILGAVWDSVPINYDSASGIAKDFYKTTQRSNFAVSQAELATKQANVNAANNAINSAMQLVEGVAISPVAPQYGGQMAVQGGMNLITGAVTAQYNREKIEMDRRQALKREALNFQLDNVYVAPQLTGQVIEGIQQYLGNGCIAYSIYPSLNDLYRFGDIIANFGWARDMPVRQNSSIIDGWPKTAKYIAGRGITITTTSRVPRRVKEDCENLLNNGVRLWGIKPRTLTYADLEA